MGHGGQPVRGTEQPPARRKRRWPWVLATIGGLILLLVAAGYLYNLHWQHKVDALLASYRAKGEPVTWEEVLAARDTLPPEQNSALIFHRAFPLLGSQDRTAVDALDSLLGVYEPGARPSQRTTELLRAHIKQQAPILAIIREGAALQTGFYPVNPADPPEYVLMPSLSPLRAAVRLCAREAELRALDGDGPGAVESLVDARRLCASLGECWITIEELVRLASDALTVAEVEKSLELCQFPPEGVDRLRGEFAREEGELSLRPALLGERAFWLHFLARMSTVELLGEIGPEVLYDFVPGMRGKNALLAYSVFDRSLALAEMPLRKQTAGISSLAKALEGEQIQHGRAYAVSGMLMPALSRAMGAVVEARVRLQVVDTALAVEQWRMKHGRWPNALDELVPEVLKAVPEDPYSGTPLSYLRTERGVTVYSVGPDGNDDGGAAEYSLPGGGGDLPFHLLNPELRGAMQTSFADEVRKSGVGTQDLMALGVTADELRAAGVDATELPANESQ